jgi:ABC-type nitrate/sulfonate/bicarbonate transport system ATPase subunit
VVAKGKFLLKLIYGLPDLNSGSISYKPILGPKYNLIPGVATLNIWLKIWFNALHHFSRKNVGNSYQAPFASKKTWIQELLEMVEMTEFTKLKPKI